MSTSCRMTKAAQHKQEHRGWHRVPLTDLAPQQMGFAARALFYLLLPLGVPLFPLLSPPLPTAPPAAGGDGAPWRWRYNPQSREAARSKASDPSRDRCPVSIHKRLGLYPSLCDLPLQPSWPGQQNVGQCSFNGWNKDEGARLGRNSSSLRQGYLRTTMRTKHTKTPGRTWTGDIPIHLLLTHVIMSSPLPFEEHHTPAPPWAVLLIGSERLT
jgi:hypothetical protein